MPGTRNRDERGRHVVEPRHHRPQPAGAQTASRRLVGVPRVRRAVAVERFGTLDPTIRGRSAT
ncbi:hypothetical protein DEJ16_13300 [Curtobacterium sp. MCJR17_055]|uniref:hypothetical protein n=1 Tax=Curtobacterium sp. MCJR17_043 TaxID=2175660 RepID=UPI000D827CD1|nr:hypothetical protein [Curtobacterium sp. MCJR17_043]PYY34202.1 hypothetical protein DEI87_10725 [Curtobacterium sp. MCBD17_029]PYY54053.1 hypothetical protein DEJ16_13300 [Curtobacterium sp. MCJR17_055]PYY59062.1 hypothetical protein DEJ26_08515 [Curtobacterium sp. MCPF17_015]WIB34733.1 hypothetical protein DEJ15_08845 [Curtobacterium sp. MCJR17_043]